jgi:hypothetical protein
VYVLGGELGKVVCVHVGRLCDVVASLAKHLSLGSCSF